MRFRTPSWRVKSETWASENETELNALELVLLSY